MLAFSGDESRHEQYYSSMKNALSDPTARTAPFDMSVGTHVEGSLFARSFQLAAADATLERAGNQQYADKVTDLLPVLEEDYDIIPGAFDTMTHRRAVLAARMMVPGGGRRENVVASLRRLLGSKFLQLVEPKSVEPNIASGVWVKNMYHGGRSLFRPWSAIPKYGRLLEPVSIIGEANNVAIEAFPGSEAFEVGDVLFVDAGNTGTAEAVTVDELVDGNIVATFSFPHDEGSIVSTMHWPAHASTMRHLIVVVTDASDMSVRRVVNDIMAKLARAVDTWAIVQPTAPNTLGPMQPSGIIGGSLLGTASFAVSS